MFGPGAVQRPAEVEAHVAQRERLLHFDDLFLAHRVANLLLAFGADLQVAADVLAMAAAAEAQRAHFDRHRLQRNPGGDRMRAGHRPVLLIDVPRREAAGRLLVQRLIVPHPHAARAHQLGRDAGQPLAERELANALAARPQVHDLNERLVVERALFERNVFEAIAFVDEPIDLRRDSRPALRRSARPASG